MSKTKNAMWDDLENHEDTLADEMSAIAESKYMVSKMAEDVETLTNQEMEWFAEALTTYNKEKAERLTSLLQYQQQDRHYQQLTEIVKSTNWVGTHLHGHIRRSYWALRDIFGEPHMRWSGKEGEENKIDVEWCFAFPDGRVFTVYNWKNGRAYLGDEGAYPDQIKHWNIGAHEQSTYDDVVTLLDMKLGKE